MTVVGLSFFLLIFYASAAILYALLDRIIALICRRMFVGVFLLQLLNVVHAYNKSRLNFLLYNFS